MIMAFFSTTPLAPGLEIVDVAAVDGALECDPDWVSRDDQRNGTSWRVHGRAAGGVSVGDSATEGSGKKGGFIILGD